MKKATVGLVLAVCLAGFAGVALAGTTDSITVTVSLIEEISVSLSGDGTWSIGPIALSGSDILSTVTANNNGNVSIDLVIKGANGAGGWTIGTPIGTDQFKVALGDPVISLTTSDQTLTSDLAKGADKTIDMTYTAPDVDTKGGGVDQGFDITVTASKFVP